MGPAQQLVNIRRHPHMFARRHLAGCARKSVRCRPPLFANMTDQQFPKTCRPTFGGSRRREMAQRPEVRASTALGGTSRSAACARKCSRERVREFYGL